MQINKHNVKDILEVTLANYELGEWGSSNLWFRVPASISERFGGSAEDAFDDIALSAFTLLSEAIPVLLRFPKAEWIPDSDKETVRIAVFKIMQYWADNNLIRYNTTTSTISTPTMSMTQDSSEVLLTTELIGIPAWTYIQRMPLWKTYVFTDFDDYVAFTQENTGNYEVIGKFDLDKFKELV